MVALLAWVLFPALVYGVATGLALLAGRLLRAPLPADLVAPVGACLTVVVALPAYKLGAGAAVGAPLVAGLAVAGHVLERRRWRERLVPGWPAVAAIAGYGLFIAPVVLSGQWTWLGYNFVNDTAVNMIMVDHVAEHGIRIVDGPATTTANIIGGTLGARYPMGLHGSLASLHGLVGFVPLESVYQPFIAVLAGLAAMALAALAMRIGMPGALAAGLGTVAAGANLTYHYAAHGAFKEIALVLVVAAAAALSRYVVDEGLPPGAVAQLGMVFAAGILIFSTAAIPYAGLFGAVVLVAAVGGRPRPRPARLALAAGAGAAAVVVAALPGLGDALAFGRSAGDFYRAEGGLSGPNSTAFLGHLLRPLPLVEAIGIWPEGDYRGELVGAKAAVFNAFAALVGLLLAAATVVELRRRRPGALIALVPCIVVYLVAMPRLGPYAEAKLLVLLAPAVVFGAGLGAWYISRRVAPAGAVAGLLIAGGVLYSDALAYHNVRLAPVDRLQAIEEAAQRAPADALILFPEWEEWAKYYARERRINVSSESFSPMPVELRDYVPFFARSFDLDELQLPYVERFDALLLRRAPDRSRPPASYRLAHRNDHYELWLRDVSVRVVDHLPQQDIHQPAGTPSCSLIQRLAAAARPGEVLLAAPRRRVPIHDYSAQPPLGWHANGVPQTVTPGRPGRTSGRVAVRGGRYRVWVRGTTGRSLEVSIDGRPVGRATGVNTPGQWLVAGEVELRRGLRDVELLRPGGSLAPGDGYAGELGPVALEPMRRSALVEVAPADAERRLCRRSWDWVERVRRTGRDPEA